jgi:1-deoxy-D-xylulose-5-phosphate reductoisomerase
MRHICVLGSTGSIGVNTLEVIRAHPDLFKVESLTAHSNIELLAKQCAEFKPRMVVLGSVDAANRLNEQLKAMGLTVTVEHGAKALVNASTLTSVDTVMAAIVGSAGLLPTIEAAKLGKRILLANKEALVMAGGLFMSAIASGGAELLPIDSEHNAIYQCLPDANTSNGGSRGKYPSLGVKEILLTASGGPFRNHSLDQLKEVTPDQACAHPNWTMGRKISVDSATMMNKGLEVIEAHHLFGLSSEQIKVLIHPQSVVHSMVRYIDGSVIAQLGQPDMKTPIAYGLGWPLRIDAGVKELDFTTAHDFSFEPADLSRFPCLSLSYQALATGGFAPTILNAANEVAVDSFLNHGIRFTQIAELVERALNQTQVSGVMSLDGILEADKVARQHAQTMVKGMNA